MFTLQRTSLALDKDILNLSVAAPPREGEANAAVVETTAELLKMRKSQVSLKIGHKSRDKMVFIEGVEMEDVLDRLQAVLE